MSFVKDVTIGEGESIPPDTPFIKTWRIQNTGTNLSIYTVYRCCPEKFHFNQDCRFCSVWFYRLILDFCPFMCVKYISEDGKLFYRYGILATRWVSEVYWWRSVRPRELRDVASAGTSGDARRERGDAESPDSRHVPGSVEDVYCHRTLLWRWELEHVLLCSLNYRTSRKFKHNIFPVQAM